MKLLTSIFISSFTAAALSASTATLTSDLSGKCILNQGGNSFQALNIEQPKASSGNITTVDMTSLMSKSSASSSQLFGEQAYLFGEMGKTGITASAVNSIQQAVYALSDSTYKVDATADSYLKQAQQCYKTADFTNLVVATLTDNKGADCGKVIIDRNPICDPSTPTPVQASATPEPGTFLLLGGGLIFAGTYARRKNKNVTN